MTEALQKPDLRAERGLNPDVTLIILEKDQATRELRKQECSYTEGGRENMTEYTLMLFFRLT